ncbi:MAG: ADP-ribosylglycohydrolase family protein [Phycisphaerae bacterium]
MYPPARILGCLLGCAVGDAIGLPREGLTVARAARLFGPPPLRHALLFGRGLCSDDTEHLVMTARALCISNGDVTVFTAALARDLRCWIATLPAGVGFATLRACLKLCIGMHPPHSAVRSAGNGPAMRAAIIGLAARDDSHLFALADASATITHSDPRAIDGARIIALAARRSSRNEMSSDRAALIDELAAHARDPEFRELLITAAAALRAGNSPSEFAAARNWHRGVSGFINHTVTAALLCWLAHPGDFRGAVESAVTLGGDTDTVAAITGSLVGCELGPAAIPQEWTDRLIEWPRNVDWMRRLAAALSESINSRRRVAAPAMHWPRTIPRNAFFGATVLLHAARRLLP